MQNGLSAPLLNVFRFDLTLGHFIIFDHAWTLCIDSILQNSERVDATIKIFTWVLILGVIG